MIGTRYLKTEKHLLKGVSEFVELERLANKSHLLKSAIGLIPGLPKQDVVSIQDTLEIECGAGVWPLEMAQTYQQMRITGLDDRPAMINYALDQAQARRLENVDYLHVSSLTEQLPLSDGSFDLVSAQFLSKVLKCYDWPLLLRECWRLLRPGGFLQLTEYEIGTSNSPAHNDFFALYVQAMALYGGSFSEDGHDLGYCRALPQLLQEAGFESIYSVTNQIDYSSGQEEGYRQDFLLVAQNMQQLIMKMGVSTYEEIQRLHQQQQQEIRHPYFRAFLPVGTFYGRKRGR